MESEKKVAPILLRMTESLHTRLTAMSELRHIGRQHLIRLCIDDCLRRMETEFPGVKIAPQEAAALAQARALGIDPLLCLTQAVEARLAQQGSELKPAV